MNFNDTSISTAQLHNRFKLIHKTQMLLVPTAKSNNSGTYFEIRLNLFQLKCKTVFQNQQIKQRINKETASYAENYSRTQNKPVTTGAVLSNTLSHR